MLALLLRVALWAIAAVLVLLWLLACGVVWVVEAIVAWRRKAPLPRLQVPRGTGDSNFGRTAGAAVAILLLVVLIGGGSGPDGSHPTAAQATAASSMAPSTTDDPPATASEKREAKAKRRAAKARAEKRAAARRAKARAERRRREREAAAKPQPNCDPSYKGACLDPNASDYDCSGGSGDGPKYAGTVSVVGDDHYDLDRDGDGTGCD